MPHDRQDRPTRRHLLASAAALGAVAVAPFARAQAAYPSRPISWVVPYPSGGFGDAVSRMLTQKMTESMGQTIVVDNRPGAGGQIGASYVKMQPADGYTVLYGDIGPFSMNSSLYPKLGYDMTRDFQPLTRLFLSPLVVVTSVNGPYKTFADLLKAAKADKPINYGSYGTGSQPHVWTEMLKRQAGGNFTHIPYKGAAPALQDIMGNRLDMMADVVASSIPFVKEGKLRALAVVGSSGRLAQLPDVPTMSELGYGSVDIPGWNGVAVKAGTPDAVVQRLHKEVVAAVKHPDVVKFYANFGLTVATQSPQQFAEFVESERQRWGAVIREAQITLD